MLDVSDLDLRTLADALEDHSEETSWWFDPASGEIEPWAVSAGDEDHELPVDRGLVPIEPVASGEGYRDMEDFIGRVGERAARDRLERAIGGRGAFRRFKDTLLEFPDLREAWFAFHDARMERRAIGWLVDAGLIDLEQGKREIGARPDPLVERVALLADQVVRAVVNDLEDLYGERLRGVVLFGSRARDDAHPESDIDLLVVLDRVDSAWEELRRMEPTVWEHSFANDVVVSAVPVSEDDFRAERSPLLRRAAAEGRQVA